MSVFKKFPFYKQFDTMDCGPSCLRMIASHYGKAYSLQFLRDRSYISRLGVSAQGIIEAAESIGMRSLSALITYEQLEENVPLPCIVHWKQKHFVVVYKAKKDKIYVADPAFGLTTYTKKEFNDSWMPSDQDRGVAIFLETTPAFYTDELTAKDKNPGWKMLWPYMLNHKKQLFQLLIGMLLGSFLGLIFPFLTQSVVDIGIKTNNIGFIYLVLLGQLMVFAGRTLVEGIRSWILLHVGSRVSISIVSDFLFKLMQLPVSFFDSKMMGDILQRIQDNSRIQAFLTSSVLNVLFSFFNIFVFSFVLGIYSMKILVIFLIAILIQIGWFSIFLKRRKEIDHKRFSEMSENHSKLVEIISGMQEIKLSNAENQKRWEWEGVQARLFKLNQRSLNINLYQQNGTAFINELKTIFITILSAQQVVEGTLTLGEMLAISYIIGQLNGPLNQLISFIQAAQDTQMSIDRLGEIHARDNEDMDTVEKSNYIPDNKTLTLTNVSFRYNPLTPIVLKNINLKIPQGKVTAIVGASGSGKTTLLKLLLKFYEPTDGEITVGAIPLKNISTKRFRKICGVVMQDGYLFSDSIVNNITMGDTKIRKVPLFLAANAANADSFIDLLPNKYNTKIGAEGNDLSQGQKQRLMIAKAIYKNPDYLFFDEATNALDTTNEKTIMKNLESVFEGKTVISVAHRLSTVKNADQIIVLNKGEIVEQGTHQELTVKRGYYYELIKDQLELGE